MRVLLSHPGCGPFVQQTARALEEAGVLAAYVTTFHDQPGTLLGTILRAALRLRGARPEEELARRRITEIAPRRIISYPGPELLRTAVAQSPLGPIITDRVWEWAECRFDRLAARHVEGADAVYGYEHAALATFQAQKARGGRCLYELPIPHYRTVQTILDEELVRFPEAGTPYDRHVQRQAPRRNARKEAELRLADRIIVNSTFSRQSLERVGVPPAHIQQVPLGAPPVSAEPPVPRKAPFIILSAGSQSLRKGVHYLLQAWRRLTPGRGVELWLVGPWLLPRPWLAGLPGTVVVRPSLPRPELFALYRRASVLALPSLCEGFGMVITEAMAHGLPVITTPHTAGPDLLTDGRDGLLVPIRDVDRLATALHWGLDHPDALAEMGRQAMVTAARWQWPDYRRALGAAVLESLRKAV